MVNIFGPGLTGDQATATRPTQVSTGQGTDLWFQDCTSEAAQDGTRVRAQFLNFIMANFREAVRGLSVAENETDDLMLLKCFQSLQTSNWLNLPIYPHILGSTGKLTITAGSGNVVIDSGQSFLHRGWEQINTSDYSAGARTLSHSASKTYHVRWQYNAGSPQFVIKDLADGVYNPGLAFVDEDEIYDSTFDDMLIAQVVTNGSNVATITTLWNAALMRDVINVYTLLSGRNANGSNDSQFGSGIFSWARTPKWTFVIRNVNTSSSGTSYPGSSTFSGSDGHDIDYETNVNVANRYEIELAVQWDWASDFDGDFVLDANNIDPV